MNVKRTINIRIFIRKQAQLHFGNSFHFTDIMCINVWSNTNV